jgi:hypothetical protein
MSSQTETMGGSDSAPSMVPHGETPRGMQAPEVCFNGDVASGAIDVEQFYRDFFWALDEFGRRPGATALGTAAVAKRVAKAHGLEVADRLPLPRLNRAELQDRADNKWRSEQ